MYALAAALSLGLGMTQFQPQKENHWYQRRYPHELTLRSPAVTVGWQTERWYFYYAYLGRAKSWALADPEDENYRPEWEAGGPCKRACRVPVEDLPVWRGSGQMHGVGARYRFENVLIDGLFIEPGVMAFRPTWTQHVDRWYPHDPAIPAAAPPPWRADITVKHAPKISLTPELTVGYRVSKDFSVTVDYRVRTQQGGTYAPIFKYGAVTVGVRYTLW